jgi:excisionase family DNA binding protein
MAATQSRNIDEGLFLTRQAAARQLRVCLRTLAYWLATGKLPAYKIAGRTVIAAADVQRLTKPSLIKRPLLVQGRRKAGAR